jgi:selenocysteine lyase/cysteine desulfurase/tRNA(Ile)-lysidine synthase TilS/MesJ
VDVVSIGEDATGHVDMDELQAQLREHSGRPLRIGSFSAASNVTGVLTDQDAVTACLHQHGALAFWDFASAGPYVPIDMNPLSPKYGRSEVQKDAIFISPHKFIGGVGTPGVLIAKRSLFSSSSAPSTPGGGSVFYVSRDDHRYLKETEWREEAGTPAIVESIRCGLVFQLKQSVGTDYIHSCEDHNVQRGFDMLGSHPSIHVLGPGVTTPRLPIFSFVIEHKDSGLFLHHNFVAALLNDLFGIQARGGCACAGPYAQELLGIDRELSKKFEDAIMDDRGLEKLLPRERDRINSGKELIRPGFVRISLNYFVDPKEVEFVLKAVCMVADMGWACLPQYTFNADTGEWKHRRHDALQTRSRRWIGAVDFNADSLFTPSASEAADVPTLKSGSEYYDDCLVSAQKLLRTALTNPTLDVPGSAAGLGTKMISQQTLLLSEEQKQGLRWFLFPEEALQILRGDANKAGPKQTKVAVTPKQYGSCFEHAPCRTDDVSPDLRKEEPTRSSVASIEAHPSTEQQSEWPAQRAAASSQPTSNPEPEPEPEPNMELMPAGMDLHDATPDLPSVTSSNENLAVVASTPVWKCWKPPKVILKKVYEAIKEHDMIRDGDRILIGVSGGKDSLTLVQVMYYLKKNWRWLGVQFDFGCVTVDPETEAFDPSPLKVYFKALGIPYFYESQNIIQAAQSANGGVTSICSFCSRMKRGRLYACIRREGYNVLALGQHLDDLAESFMMSAFHNGFLRTMKAAYTNDEGDIRIIRPFVNTRERDIAAFAADKELPIIPENCPACFSAPKERARMKQLLAAQEHMFPNIYNSLRSAMQPLMSITETGQEKQKGGQSSHHDEEDEMLLGCD